MAVVSATYKRTTSQRQLCIHWAKVAGASIRRKRLKLRENADGEYVCPVEQCLHCPFKSKRGCRKHVDTTHGWYYHFDSAPVLTPSERNKATLEGEKKPVTCDRPSFSVHEGFGKEVLQWLCTPCGGSKKVKDAQQSATRSMKFLMFTSGNNVEEILTHNFVDCCVGSPSAISAFLEEIQNNWKLQSSGSYNYLKSISDLMDFRKASGVSDNTLRSFTVTEVYLRRGMRSLSR